MVLDQRSVSCRYSRVLLQLGIEAHHLIYHFSPPPSPRGWGAFTYSINSVHQQFEDHLLNRIFATSTEYLPPQHVPANKLAKGHLMKKCHHDITTRDHCSSPSDWMISLLVVVAAVLSSKVSFGAEIPALLLKVKQ